jgi:hypothetical protein
MDFINDIYSISFEGIIKNVHQYRFISSVASNDITKIVSLSPINDMQEWFNLGFGNLEKNDAGEIVVNDTSENNNPDFDKVLATVFSCLMQFLNNNPTSRIIFFGNTEHKHITYKRKISANLEQLQEFFLVQGGYANFDVTIIEKEQEIQKRNKVIKRIIRIKDTNTMKINKIESFEIFNPQK